VGFVGDQHSQRLRSCSRLRRYRIHQGDSGSELETLDFEILSDPQDKLCHKAILTEEAFLKRTFRDLLMLSLPTSRKTPLQ
jgi:hypothetical protein